MPILIGTVIVVAVVLVALAANSRRADSTLLWRGIRYSIVAAVVVLVGLTLFIGVGLTDRSFLFSSTYSAAAAFGLGFVVGISVGGAIVVLGAAFTAAGLLLGRGALWITTAWLVGPLVSLGVAFVLQGPIRSVIDFLQPDPYRVTLYRSEVSLNVARDGGQPAAWTITGGCELETFSNLLRIRAEDSEETALINVTLSTDPAQSQPVLSLNISNHEWSPPTVAMGDDGPSTGTYRAEPGWTVASGTVTFANAVPFVPGRDPVIDPTARWAGSVTWTCSDPE